MNLRQETEPQSEANLMGTYKDLYNKLVLKSLVARMRGNVYIYVEPVECWCILCSPEAERHICDILKMENVTVNYSVAAAPYTSKYLPRKAIQALPPPRSVCIGKRRLRITMNSDSNGVTLVDCDPLIGSNNNKPTSAQLCIMPCLYDHIPSGWDMSEDDDLKRYISQIFSNPLDLITLMWMFGNAFVDPVHVSRFLLLYGEGGSGKTTVMHILSDCMRGACGNVAPSCFLGKSPDMPHTLAKAAANNRLVCAGDLDLEHHKLNIGVMKSVTGQDPVIVGDTSIRTATTIVAASNSLPDPTDDAEWNTPAVNRRTVVLGFDIKADELPKNLPPDDYTSRLAFMLESAYIFLKYPDMPISPRSVLLKICGSKYYDILPYITYDDNADPAISTTVTFIIATHMSMSTVKFISEVESMSRYPVGSIGGIKYLRGVSGPP